jgi:hypothetical protein
LARELLRQKLVDYDIDREETHQPHDEPPPMPEWPENNPGKTADTLLFRFTPAVHEFGLPFFRLANTPTP